jgi:hypothetical protein
MPTFLEDSQDYWKTDAAMRGLHKAMLKMPWPDCSKDDSEDEGGGGDRRKRSRSAKGQYGRPNKRRGVSEMDLMNSSLRSPGSSSTSGRSSTGGSSKSSPS